MRERSVESTDFSTRWCVRGLRLFALAPAAPSDWVLKAYVELRNPPVRDIEQELKLLWLRDIPEHPSVEVIRGDVDLDQESENADVVLRITRPELHDCPPPPEGIAGWIKPGWDNVDGGGDFLASRNILDHGGLSRIERFDDVPERVSVGRQWRRERDAWQVAERQARQSMAIFQSVYEWFGIHEREPERIEILAADGLLNCADDQGEFNHPVLLQRLELELYPAKRNSQFVFRMREQPPELYLEFLRALSGADLRQIAQCADELKATEVSPFGGKDTDGFLQRLIQGVFPPSGQIIAAECFPGTNHLGNAANGPDIGAGKRNGPVLITLKGDRYELSNPDASKVTGPITPSNLESSIRRLEEHGWEPKLRNSVGPTIKRDPIIFMRRQQSGMSQVFDSILKDIATRTDFPAALLQIVGLTHAAPENHEEDYSSFRIGNEDEDVLLSKPANKEQLEIARQLARRDCVLVQGPPGTGKTHTIANLLGHLLAQGKSVLVTAHTPKALRVLRHKVVESLQPLCLSVLQNDKQSQEELQQSVRLIHSGLSQNDQLLEREAEKLKQSRSRILGQLRENRALLLDAIQDETREIVFGGGEIRPIDAAKRVKLGLGSLDWIPSPVKLGAAAPLSHAESVTLYQTNARVTRGDERELNANRPDVSALPTPKEFSGLLDEVAILKSQDLRYRADLWTEPGEAQQSCQFDSMLALAISAIEFLRDRTPWELDAIQAGRDGDEAKRVWDSLIQLIESTWREVQDSQDGTLPPSR